MNPILVLGMNRGGTTMLGNLLCRHPQMVAPQHELHWGCKESQVLLHKQYWADFQRPQRYAQFLEEYCDGDYFILADGDYDYFARNRPTSFYEFFLELMDQFCARRGAAYWVMKIEERFYHYDRELDIFLRILRERYLAPRFIGILRDFEGVLKSHLRRRVTGDEVGRSRLSARQQKYALSQTLRFAAQRPKIRRIVRQHHGLMLDFADVTDDLEGTSRTICDFLGLEYNEAMLERDYTPNTSFASSRERQDIIAPWQLMLLDRLALPIFEALHPVGSAWRRWRDTRDLRVSPIDYRLREAGLVTRHSHSAAAVVREPGSGHREGEA